MNTSADRNINTILNTIIIDDEPMALEKMKFYVEKISFLNLAGVFSSAIDATEALNSGDIDLVITDINMPDFNGIELIKSLETTPMVIFTTAHSQYAVESYKLSAIDYLLKPFSFGDFSRATHKALRFHTSINEKHQTAEDNPIPDQSIFIKTDYKYVRVDFNDIQYIKGYGEYLQIFLLSSTSPLVTLSSFSAIKKRLPGFFIQVHRSYIVNMNHVAQIDRNRLHIVPDNYIPVSDGFKPAFQKYLSSHSIGRIN